MDESKKEIEESFDEEELSFLEEKQNNSLDDEDDLDLVELVSANANDTSQYLIFEGSDGQYYAKNVSKIEELLVYSDLEIAKNNNDSLIIGTANIRGNMVPIIRFDEWFGNEVLDDSEYELVILAYYGGHRLGIVIKKVEYIVNIPAENMTDNSQNDEKTLFITKVNIGKKSELCLIFDSDKMLLDIFETVDANKVEEQEGNIKVAKKDKIVLFADDSKFIRQMATDLFEKMDIKYKMYENGQLFVDDLQNFKPEDISLFITDLEMPALGGREVIETIRNDNKYDDINIIVHTNMSNDNMGDSLLDNGAQEIIGKVNMLALWEAMQRLMR